MKDEKDKEDLEFDFGVGKLKFGGIFKSIGSLIDLASKLSEEAQEINKSGEIEGLGGKLKGVYGFSVRTMGGKPVLESFGNMKETPTGLKVEEEREPIVDIFDEESTILLVAELPGVESEDIELELRGDIFNLKAEKGDRRYSKEVLLPAQVESGSMQSSYKNGILEVKFIKSGDK